MKALTLTQPWAQLIARGEKYIETRSWPTNYRGPLAIHAAKGLAGLGHGEIPRPGKAELEFRLHQLVQRAPFYKALGGAADYRVDDIIGGLPMGCIVATCNLVAVEQITYDGRRIVAAPGWQIGKHERDFGDYTPGRYGWMLADVAPIREPIPVSGSQMLWEVERQTHWELELAELQLDDATLRDSPRCVKCGCTNNIACGEGCGWQSLDPPVCTSCV